MDAGFDPAHDEVTMDITVDVARLRPIAMSRAITNLLSNARRHGAPPYTISAKRDGGIWSFRLATLARALTLPAHRN
jgi:signal transduction histidine kinase